MNTADSNTFTKISTLINEKLKKLPSLEFENLNSNLLNDTQNGTYDYLRKCQDSIDEYKNILNELDEINESVSNIKSLV